MNYLKYILLSLLIIISYFSFGQATDLFISEYIEGSGENKFIEIYNGTGGTVDLSDYQLHQYNNGSPTITYTLDLAGSLADGDVFTIERSAETLGFVADLSTTSAVMQFNGDDAIVLYKISTASNIDIFGNIGCDPGSAWTVTNTTVNKTLVRNSSVCAGVSTDPSGCSATAFPTIDSEWTQYNQDDISNLGSHTASCSCSAPTTQASNITFSAVDITSMNVNWTSGDGSSRIVIINTSNSFTDPVNGTDPVANSTYGGSGEQVVYNGSSNSVTVDGLTPGVTYWFRVYEFNCSGASTIFYNSTATNNPNSQATTTCVAPTIQVSNITFPSVSSSSMNVSWTNGNGSYRVVIINTSNSFTNPIDGTDPVANSVYGGSGEQVIYNGTSNNVTVTGLTASTTYWFRVYEYNCTGIYTVYIVSTAVNNPNSQSTTAVPVPAVLLPGDFAVVGVCSNISSCVGGTPGDDEISFVCFKDITAGTAIDMTDNGWERCFANYWGNSEGYLRFSRTGSTITAGTVITIRLNQSGSALTGIFPDNDWSIDIEQGPLILNSNGDQIFFMQGGTWDEGDFICDVIGGIVGAPPANRDCQNATYTGGDILFGFNTNDSWTSGICDTANNSSGGGRSQNSGLIDGMDCFSMMPSGATDYLKYTGPQTIATQIEWIGRINDNSNWTSFANCTDYYSATPNYETGHTLLISSTGIDITYNWYGNKNTEWFDCANWGTLRVPTASTNVVIPNSANVDNDIVLLAGENAQCKDFTISHPFYAIRAEGDATKVLTVNKHFTINAGIVDFNDGNNATADGTIYIAGGWYNNSNTTNFDRGNSSVIFNGAGNHLITSNDGVENFYDLTIVSPSILLPGSNNLQISGDWNNYNQSGLTEATGNIEFDGTANQSISTPGGEFFYDLQINNPTTVTMQNNVTVSNEMDQKLGEIVINGNTLTLQNNLIRTTGTFTGSNSSNLMINGTGNLPTSLYFTPGSQSLNNLTINRSSSGTVTLATNLTVYNILSISSGELSINDNILTLNGTIAGTGTLKGSVASDIVIGGSGVLGTMYFSVGSRELENLTTNRATGISTLGTDLTVNTQLTLTNGIITTGANILIVSNPVATSVQSHNLNSYINGNLRRNVNATGSYDFPIGTSSQYELANINLNSATGTSYLDAKFTNPHSTSIDISPLALVMNGTPVTNLLNYGFWTISPDAYTAIDYDVTLTSRGHTNAGTTADQHTIVKRIDAANDWNVYPANHNNANQSMGAGFVTAKLVNMTAFSDMAIARSDAFPLPVELISFDANLKDDLVELNWLTESETNNDYFSIERSTDGMKFREIIKTFGAGNSNSLLSYTAYDRDPIKGINYYRLMQYDYDGKSTNSNIVAVNVLSSNNNGFVSDITINEFVVNIDLFEAQEVRLQIIDISGKTLYTSIDNNSQFKLNIRNLAQGFYFIRISSENEVFNYEFFR